jgi:hypothetical protein
LRLSAKSLPMPDGLKLCEKSLRDELLQRQDLVSVILFAYVKPRSANEVPCHVTLIRDTTQRPAQNRRVGRARAAPSHTLRAVARAPAFGSQPLGRGPSAPQPRPPLTSGVRCPWAAFCWCAVRPLFTYGKANAGQSGAFLDLSVRKRAARVTCCKRKPERWWQRRTTPLQGGVLQGGHAACILVEPVEKPTDNGSASLLCCRVADADSSETISPALAPAHFPTPLRAPGARGCFDVNPGPVAEGGTGRRKQDHNPRLRGSTKGTEVARGCPHRVEPHAERLRVADQAFRGPKNGCPLECRCCVLIWTLGPIDSQSHLWWRRDDRIGWPSQPRSRCRPHLVSGARGCAARCLVAGSAATVRKILVGATSRSA